MLRDCQCGHWPPDPGHSDPGHSSDLWGVSVAVSYLRLQVNVGQRHLCHFVEADWEGDGAEDEETVVDGNPHQDDGLDVSLGHLDQQGADQVYNQEEKADAEKDQIQRQSGEGVRVQLSKSFSDSNFPSSCTYERSFQNLPVLEQSRRVLWLSLEVNLQEVEH